MNLLRKLTTRTVSLLIEPNQVTIKDEASGRTVTRKPNKPYSCGRVFISDFQAFEVFLKYMLIELFPAKKIQIFVKNYEMHVTTQHNFHTPLSDIEKRSVIDGCQIAGARYIWLNGGKD